MDLQKLIKEIPDFPKKGIVFMDITPIMANPSAYAYAIEKMADMISTHKPDKLLATESRGFFFGPPIALKLGIPFIPIRKKGKLPRETIDVSYQLEYGTDTRSHVQACQERRSRHCLLRIFYGTWISARQKAPQRNKY